jgi:multidrug transporter EmrE-like cation transporter
MLTLSGWLTTLLAAVLTIGANVLMRAGFGVGQRGFLADGMHLAMEPAFMAGMFLYGSAALVWFYVVSTQPLSTAYIVMVSVTFLGITVLDTLFFGVAIYSGKLIGMSLILAGIACIAWVR